MAATPRGPSCRPSTEEATQMNSSKSTSAFVGPEPSELRDQGVREEHVPGTATLGDFGANLHAGARRPVRRVDVTHVQPDDLRQAEAGAEGQAVDEVIARMTGGRSEDRGLLGSRQGGRAQVGHRVLPRQGSLLGEGSQGGAKPGAAQRSLGLMTYWP